MTGRPPHPLADVLRDVRTVAVATVAADGAWKGKRYPTWMITDPDSRHLDMCGYLLAVDRRMNPVPGLPEADFASGVGDMMLRPDPNTVQLAPWLGQRTALMLADPVTPTGDPIAWAPRQVLRRQVRRLADLGLTARVGLELEVLLQPPAGEAPWSGNWDYALDHPATMTAFLEDLEAALDGTADLESIKTESLPGQVEIALHHDEPLAAADDYGVMVHLLHSTARRHGMSVTTEPGPFQLGGTGDGDPAVDGANGLHLHLSLHDGAGPVLPGPAGGLSASGRHAVAGLLDALPDLGPLYAPYPESYARYRPGSFAPTTATWGFDNRSCAVRITGHGSNTHLEVRVAGADATVYLAVAAALGAAALGIEREKEPPAPVAGSAYEVERAVLLPRSLKEATDRYDASTVAARILGEETAGRYGLLARAALV